MAQNLGGISDNNFEITSWHINFEKWRTKMWKNFGPFGNHI